MSQYNAAHRRMPLLRPDPNKATCSECGHAAINHCDDCPMKGCQIDIPNIDGSIDNCGCDVPYNEVLGESLFADRSIKG